MQRKRRKKKRFGVFLFLLVVCIGIGIMFVPWAMQPENFREVKNKINGFLYKEDFPDSYNAKSLILVDCSDDEIFVSKNENEPQIPASLAKLFVIEYASTLADLDSIVVADYGAISLTKPGSSVAQIKEKEYFLHNLFAAMLVPSGNDAAYVVADYCGGLLSPQAESCQERVRIFMENLNLHLQQQGYLDTVLYDPSGFDMEALTTTLDLKEVVYRLLEYSWFREIVSQNTYTATLPDGSTQIWQNTNAYDSAASSGMTGGMNVALQNLVYNMYSLDLSKKISSAMQTRTKNGTRLPVNARYGYKKGKDGRLEVDPEAAKVVKMIFQMAAEGTSFADITRELNRQAIATCDEQKLSRGDQVQFQRFDTIKKKHWSPTTVSAIVRDEIYIGTRIWGKTRCSMHTGHKAVLNDETEWVRLENHHTAIIDRELFEKANEMHPKKKRSVAESRTNFTLERRKKQPALLICANCGHSLLKETEHLLKCSDARTNGDPVCRSLVIRREPMEENILGLVRQYAASMLKKGKKVSSKRQCEYKEINTTELQKQSRQLTSEKMKLYDDYKDGRIDRDSYKQRAEKISVQLDEIKRKIEDAKNSKKLLEQNELSDKIKLKDFLGIQKFDTEKLREVIKVIRVHSQDEIEIEWNFDDIFSEQR